MSRFEESTRDEWWIDFIEGDLEPSLEEDLKLLLLSSDADRKRLAELQVFREQVRQSEDVYMPESGQFYENMHDKIMAAVEQTEMEPPVERMPISLEKFKKLRPYFGGGFLAMCLAVVMILGLQSNQDADFQLELADITAEKVDQKLLIAAHKHQAFEQVVGLEAESDFLSDAAAQHFDTLSDDQAKALMNRLLE